MKIKKVVFTWKNIEKDSICLGNINRLDIVFEVGNDYPIIYIDAGNVKIEDRSLELDCKEVLSKIGELILVFLMMLDFLIIILVTYGN